MPFYSRTSPRAQWFDYNSGGIFFITTCTKEREHYFGSIKDGEIQLSSIGQICEEQLGIMQKKRPSVHVHEYVIMPNHIHLLLIIDGDRTPQADVPTDNGGEVTDVAKIINQTLGSIVGGWKSAVSRVCRNKGLSFAWQSRYHDHIVRNEEEYIRIKCYIQKNPESWGQDEFFS